MARRRPIGSVRRSQLITTYGIGSIVAVADESVMIFGLDKWDEGAEVREPRLEKKLNVFKFVLPPASEDGPDIPVVRFPRWAYCSGCSVLDEHRRLANFGDNVCNECQMPLIPSRFVVACQKGHIDDFPFFNWVHAGLPRTEGKNHRLTIRAGGVSASLKDIEIACSCAPKRPVSMEGAFERNALKDIGTKCKGGQPWLSNAESDCKEIPRTLQRGASNVWFPNVESALSIPPWSEGAFKAINRHWPALEHAPDEAIDPIIRGMNLAAKYGYTVEDLVEAVKLRKRRDSEDEGANEALKPEEYDALVRGKPETSSHQDFVCVEAEDVGTIAKEWFDKVMVAKRLREVRVLESFTRLHPPDPADSERRSPLALSQPGWLPAIEVTGEGVFISLRQDLLSGWESQPNVVERVARVDKNYNRRFVDFGTEVDRVITPRLLLVHTLAHALINQWALDSGYPAAALTERVYVADSMAGFLIYTATTDSAGSLGGVVAQAEGGRLGTALHEGVSNAAWCSSDPLCIEAAATGADGLNLAACHACVLLPEVSCEEGNRLLDRALLIGTPDDPQLGFFASMMEGSA